MSVRSNALIISMFVAATLTGCDRDPIAGKPHIGPAAVSPHNAYAGAPVTIRAAGLEKLQSVEIWTDTFPLTVLARGGDSVVAELPRTARGSYTLQLGKNGPPLGGVNIIGYVGEKPTPRLLGFYLDVWPAGTSASVVTSISQFEPEWQAGEIFELRPGTGTMTRLVSGFRNSDASYSRLPGRTPDPNVYLLQPFNTAQPVQVWRMLPTPQVLDTLSFVNFRHAALFNDSITFIGLHHRVETRTSNRLIYQGSYEETHEVIISPTRDRATLRVNGSQTGPPVFNTATGDTAYHVRSLFRSYGAAFSANGDTLWMMGVTRTHVPVVVMLRARTGEVLKQAEFAGIPFTAMRRDPNGGRLFIFAYDYPQEPIGTELVVIDDQTLEVRGRVAGPVCDGWCDWSVVAVGLDGVFVVQPRAIYEFDYQRF